jgi:hypothetical protein
MARPIVAEFIYINARFDVMMLGGLGEAVIRPSTPWRITASLYV